MKTHLSKIRGFTLIELLVVIAIIGLLTGIVMTSLTGSKAKARDVKRISDIGNIQLALELYFDRCKQYPAFVKGSSAISGSKKVTLSTNFNNNCPVATPAITLGSYISQIPTSPSPGSYSYYVNSEANPTDYVLSVTLENYNEILKDDLDSAPITGAVCGTNGSAELIYCVGPK
jgi:type II secretion system protein G